MEILYNSEIILVFSTRNCKKTLQFKLNISTALLSSLLYSLRLPHWPPRMFPLFWFCMTVCKLSVHFQVWTKIYSHILKAELFYFVGMFWTPSPGDSISIALRQLLQRGRRESYIHKFATEGAVWTSKTRYHWIHSFHMHLSYLEPILFPHSLCFLHFLFINNTGDIFISHISCPTLCNSPGILQATILEWVAFPVSRGCSQHRDKSLVSRIAGRFFTSWVTRKGQE